MTLVKSKLLRIASNEVNARRGEHVVLEAGGDAEEGTRSRKDEVTIIVQVKEVVGAGEGDVDWESERQKRSRSRKKNLWWR